MIDYKRKIYIIFKYQTCICLLNKKKTIVSVQYYTEITFRCSETSPLIQTNKTGIKTDQKQKINEPVNKKIIINGGQVKRC